MGNILARYDHGNNGTTHKEATDKIQDMKPDLNWKQAVNRLDCKFVSVDFAAQKKGKGLEGTNNDNGLAGHYSRITVALFFTGFFDYMHNNNTGV